MQEFHSLRSVLLQGEEFLPVLKWKWTLKIEKETFVEWKLQFVHQQHCRRAADGKNLNIQDLGADVCSLWYISISGKMLVLGIPGLHLGPIFLFHFLQNF